MRLADAPMDRPEFEDALDDALAGVVVSDTGATPEVQEALDAILHSPERSESLVTAARQAFDRTQTAPSD